MPMENNNLYNRVKRKLDQYITPIGIGAVCIAPVEPTLRKPEIFMKS